MALLVLGIESSCDETGVALVRTREGAVPELLGQALHSQIAMHADYGGVVPELASRDHIRRIIPLANQALACFGHHGLGEREHPADMVAAGQLGHHAAIRLVHLDLAVQRMRQQGGHSHPASRADQRHAGFIARRFNTQDQQAHAPSVKPGARTATPAG